MPLVQVARFEDPQEGAIAATALRAEGIEAMYNIEAMGSADPFMRRATGGYPLWVLTDDLAEARRILKPLVNMRAGETAIPRDDDDSDEAFDERQNARRRYRIWVLGTTMLAPFILAVLISVL